MFREHFEELAAYNRWANARLYAAALALPDELYRKPVGVFFGSLHATMNHLLLTDRLWLKRLTGEGEHPNKLNAILYDDRNALSEARQREDDRLIRTLSGFSDADLSKPFSYHTTSGQPQQQVLSRMLTHLFNHQTHHRGQCHACLSILTGAEPPSFDLLAFQRGAPAPAWPSA